MSLPFGIFRRRFLDQLQRLNIYVKADPAIHLIGIQVHNSSPIWRFPSIGQATAPLRLGQRMPI